MSCIRKKTAASFPPPPRIGLRPETTWKGIRCQEPSFMSRFLQAEREVRSEVLSYTYNGKDEYEYERPAGRPLSKSLYLRNHTSELHAVLTFG